jgi:hypothetical protein
MECKKTLTNWVLIPEQKAVVVTTTWKRIIWKFTYKHSLLLTVQDIQKKVE